jgi:hypothetical protein
MHAGIDIFLGAAGNHRTAPGKDALQSNPLSPIRVHPRASGIM